MRIVIDMQGLQTESRFRGIGRYTLSFSQAVVRNRGEHEIILVLSGLFSETIEPIRAAFNHLLPQENIRVWNAPGPVKESVSGNDNRREIAELMRESFLASLQPDVIHITSLFEGYSDDAVTSIGSFEMSVPVTAMLFDLIPMLNPKQYLTLPSYARYYQRKLQHFRQASTLLAISEFTRQEGLCNLGMSEDKIINISAAADSFFVNTCCDAESEASLRQQLGFSRPFVLYTGGSDERKNLPRLIQAYAKLPMSLRNKNQLVLAGRFEMEKIHQFNLIARSAGLKNDEMVITGHISDEQIIKLYNLCSLYVIPSWHEGFGLPALEAMACGAAVIGSNTSALCEVIDLPEAMFDPLDISDICAKIHQALTDEAFRKKLSNHGLLQAKKFSWDETARLAIAAWQNLVYLGAKYENVSEPPTSQLINQVADKLNGVDEQYLLNLSNCIAQNQSAGIERQLLVDVSELCQRDSATGVQRVVRSYLFHLMNNPPKGFKVSAVYATQVDGYRYATSFIARMFGCIQPDMPDCSIQWQRGDVFFGLDMQHHVQLANADFYHQLRQDGVVVKFLVYDLLPIQLPEFFQDTQIKELHEKLLKLVALQDEAICISQATANALKVWISKNEIPTSKFFKINWVHMGADLEGSKPSVGLPKNSIDIIKIIQLRPTFLVVSTLEPRKAQAQILDALEQLWSQGCDVNLVFVGQPGWKNEILINRINNHLELGKRLIWLTGISDEYLDLIYKSSSCLIAASINEGFGLSLVEAAKHKMPIIVRDIPVFKEIAGSSAYYFKGESGVDLANAISAWLSLRNKGLAPLPDGMKWKTWQQAAENLKEALCQNNYVRRQLFLDVSQLIQHDARTGIQRVVRALLRELQLNPPSGFRIEPVFATIDHGYRYADSLFNQSVNHDKKSQQERPIETSPGDIFFGLDLDHHSPRVHRTYLKEINQQGIGVLFMVYDLLPLQFPYFWESCHKVDRVTSEWLEVVTGFDGVVCISKSVAEDLNKWVYANKRLTKRNFSIQWFHLGSDLINSMPSMGLPKNAPEVLYELSRKISFLMVGTLEPRKGHRQVLDAFELLWDVGIDVNLIIVGKEGWMTEDLIRRLRAHKESNQRLYWLEGISDEYLEKIYSACDSLISASYGEGFGLPLIEAVQHRLSIIARDIPIFREVAGHHAHYFKADHPSELAKAIEDWIGLFKNNQHPKSDNMPSITWRESAAQLLKAMGLSNE
jgi:glycosyltransferase involved in cell wall biosynthesis